MEIFFKFNIVHVPKLMMSNDLIKFTTTTTTERATTAGLILIKSLVVDHPVI